MKIEQRIARVRERVHTDNVLGFPGAMLRGDALALCKEIERLQKALEKATYRKTADRKAYMKKYMQDYRKRINNAG